MFDMALAPVLTQLVAENPSPQNTLSLRKFFEWAINYNFWLSEQAKLDLE